MQIRVYIALLISKLEAHGLTKTRASHHVITYVTECNVQRSEAVEVLGQVSLEVYYRAVDHLFYFALE